MASVLYTDYTSVKAKIEEMATTFGVTKYTYQYSPSAAGTVATAAAINELIDAFNQYGASHTTVNNCSHTSAECTSHYGSNGCSSKDWITYSVTNSSQRGTVCGQQYSWTGSAAQPSNPCNSNKGTGG